MKEAKYLIIGGGMAGTTAAEEIRKRDTAGSIVIISDEPYRLYNRTVLLNVVAKKMSPSDIILKKEKFYKENNIGLELGKKVVKVDDDQRLVKLDDGEEIRFESLLIATGGRARDWPFPVEPKEGVYSFQTLDQAKAITVRCDDAKKAVLIGGGFVGLELAHAFHDRGLEITFLIREPYFWSFLWDEESGHLVEEQLKKNGVDIHLSEEIEKIVGSPEVEKVVTQSGKEFPADVVGIGVGLAPNVDFLSGSKIRLGKRGVKTNEYLETNVAGVYAAGDVAEFKDVIAGVTHVLGNWVNAQEHGKVAGAGMAGEKVAYKRITTYAVTFMGMNISFVGDIVLHEGDEVILRVDKTECRHCRLIARKGKIVGATLINSPRDAVPLRMMIEKGTEVYSVKGKLEDCSANLMDCVKT